MHKTIDIELKRDVFIHTNIIKFQILKPADKKKFPYGTGAGGIGSNRPVTPPRAGATAGNNGAGAAAGAGALNKANPVGKGKK